MDECRPVATPMGMKLHQRKPDEKTCDLTIYQTMIGSTMYAISTTQPNTVYGIGVLSQYNLAPSNEHMVALKRMFQYLNCIKNWQLPVGGAIAGALGRALAESTLRAEGEGVLRCYVDLDHTGCPDDYKWSCRMVNMVGEADDWNSRKQKLTAQSTTDAK